NRAFGTLHLSCLAEMCSRQRPLSRLRPTSFTKSSIDLIPIRTTRPAPLTDSLPNAPSVTAASKFVSQGLCGVRTGWACASIWSFRSRLFCFLDPHNLLVIERGGDATLADRGHVRLADAVQDGTGAGGARRSRSELRAAGERGNLGHAEVLRRA